MAERTQHERAVVGPAGSLDLTEVRCDFAGTVRPVRASIALRFEPEASPDNVAAATRALGEELSFLLRHASFPGADDAALALARYALAPPTDDAARVAVREADVHLSAPSATERPGARGRALLRAPYAYARESKPFGRVDVVHESPACGIYRLRIRPGGTIPTHVHAAMDEREMVLGGGLRVQRRPAPRGTVFRWPHGFPHRYDNPTATEQTVLCIDRPRFDPGDEREVPEPAGGLVELPPERP